MGIDPSAVGRTSAPYLRAWDDTETLLYALAVGAGQRDPHAELDLTTENSEGVAQQVVPTFAVILGQFGAPAGHEDVSFGDVGLEQIVHGDQEVRLQRPLPPSGRLEIRRGIAAIHDKGAGAVVVTEATGTDPDSGELVLTSRSGIFVRGGGGFGGDRGPAPEPWELPDREPDHVVTYATRPDAALLYRLTGDRNPLHADPAFARRAGFERPILHGLATYGFTCRALLETVLEGDASRFAAMSGRFTRPVLPGEELTVSVWREDGGALFRTSTGEDAVVLDRGRLELRG